MNKLKATLLSLALLVGMAAQPEFVHYENYSKIYAEASDSASVLKYVTDEYTLDYTVNGNEAKIVLCTDKDIDRPIYERNWITNLEIPEKIDGYTVTEIGDNALRNSMYKKLTLPDTIRKLGNYSLGSNSFSYDETFTFPRDTEEIGDHVITDMYAKKIVIPAKVSSISRYAFEDNYTFEVDSDNEYYHIYKNALMSSDNKQLIKYNGKDETMSYYVPTGTEEIFPYAFKYTSISIIRIPDSVTTIGESAFYCSDVSSVTLPKSLTKIEDNTFSCTNITQITLPDSLESIGKNAFSASDLKSVNIPENIKTIAENAFSRCDYLEEVTFHEGLESIGASAFDQCLNLKTVSFPDSLKTISGSAFSETGLTTVSIPAGVSCIDTNAFAFSDYISAFDVNKGNENYSSENGILYNKDKTILIQCPSSSSITSCILPDTVTSIADKAFYKCVNLKSIIIPDSVEVIDEYTFYNCESLESVKLSSGLKTIKMAAFSQCTGLKEVELPSGLEVIEERAFVGTAIESISIPESVGKIDNTTFSNCRNLKTIKISPYLHNFEALYSNKDISIEFYEDDSLIIKDNVVYSKDMTALVNYPVFKANDTYEFTVPESVTKIYDKAFEGVALRKITLSKNTASIGNSAFSNCQLLEEIDYNGSNPELGKGLFFGCNMLYRLELPENISVIPENAFDECTGIYSAKIPDGVTEIKSGSMPCILEEVYIPSSVTKISEDAFNFYNLSVICGEKDSYAEKFASDNNIKFVVDSEKFDGDVNGDGKTNIIDLIKLKSYLIGNEKTGSLNSDINKDGKVSVIDLVKLINILHGMNDVSGYKDIQITRERINSESVYKSYYKETDFITNEAELESSLDNYFKDSSVSKEYIEKYSPYLDEYVIYVHMQSLQFDYSVPVLDANIYSIAEGQMKFKITEIPPRYYAEKYPTYLYTVLVPKSLYNGQSVNYIYDQQVAFAAKPVIYLYPEEETTINVKVELDEKSKFACTYPEYPEETGWTVTAEPDSTLYDENGSYPYLFWEAATTREWDMSEGFVVKGEDTREFLKEKLVYLGLEPTEYTEFISFWAPKMENSKYNLIAFQTDDYEEMAKLIVTPEPESVQRVFMTYKALDEWTEVPEQKLTPFERSGYTLIEWGGSEVK